MHRPRASPVEWLSITLRGRSGRGGSVLIEDKTVNDLASGTLTEAAGWGVMLVVVPAFAVLAVRTHVGVHARLDRCPRPPQPIRPGVTARRTRVAALSQSASSTIAALRSQSSRARPASAAWAFALAILRFS